MKPGEMLSADQTRQWRRTLRLTFSYDGDTIRLIERRSVNMIPPAPNTPLPGMDEAGFWYVVRDDNHDVLYYRVISNPMPLGYEVFSPAGEQSVTNINRKRARGTFEILVPDTSEAASLSLFSSHPLAGDEGGSEDGSRQQPAREIAHFDLRGEEAR
jgi:hypothetical protein